jgi:hypothetical protein
MKILKEIKLMSPFEKDGMILLLKKIKNFRPYYNK